MLAGWTSLYKWIIEENFDSDSTGQYWGVELPPSLCNKIQFWTIKNWTLIFTPTLHCLPFFSWWNENFITHDVWVCLGDRNCMSTIHILYTLWPPPMGEFGNRGDEGVRLWLRTIVYTHILHSLTNAFFVSSSAVGGLWDEWWIQNEMLVQQTM